MVDVIFADVAQPDQARIVGLNAHMFLKNEGGVLISIKASCIDSTAKPEVVFAHEVERLRAEKIKPKERELSLANILKRKNFMLTFILIELTLGKLLTAIQTLLFLATHLLTSYL
jgi:hypothetical protein